VTASRLWTAHGGHGQLVAGEAQPAGVAGQQGPLGGPAELGPDHGRHQHPAQQPAGGGGHPQAAQDQVVAGPGQPLGGHRGQHHGRDQSHRLERERGHHLRPAGQLAGPQPDRPGQGGVAPLGPVPRGDPLAPHRRTSAAGASSRRSRSTGGRAGSGARLLVASA
jgi:hypothetical protein